MKFLDRFKRKTPTEPPLPVQKQKTQEAKKAADSGAAYKPDLKGAAKSAPASESGLAPKPAPKKPTVSENDLRLELGDFLHRIPAHLLLPGPHDLKAELHFDIGELSAKIAQGLTTVSLAEIYRRVPSIFRGEILDSDNIEVRFPWQKLAKLVNISRPAGSQESSATPNPPLADKLRAKKPARTIKTGEATAPTPDDAPPTPVLPGRTAVNKPATWFTKTTQDGTAPTTSTQPAAAPATEMPALKLQEPKPVVAEEPATQPATVAPTPTVRPVEDIRISDLPPEAQRRFATMKGEYERLISEMQAQRRSVAEARDRANSEVERLQKELERHSYQLAKEQTASSIGQDLMQRHQKEREELLAQIEELRIKAAQPQPQGEAPLELVSAAAPANDEQIQALTLERDTLLEQKAYLSSQLAEMTNRRSGPAVKGSGNVQSQRQVEELQRRIALLEGAQKEAAHELQREKEAKAKFEKLLATADRLQQDSALHMEETKIEMRKELEASFRKNIKELEEQLAAARSQTAQAAPQSNLESEPAAWQSEMMAQFEADIENYRERIKTLIRERDEARSATPAPAVNLDAEIEPLKLALEKALSESQSMREELLELRNRDAATHGLHSELESSRHRIAQLQTELSDALHSNQPNAEIEALRTQLQEKHEQISTLENARNESPELQEKIASLTEQLESLSNQHANALQQLAAEKDTHIRQLSESLEQHAGKKELSPELEHEFSSLRAEHEQLNSALAEARRQLAEAHSQIENLGHNHASELQRFTAEKDAHIQQLASSLDGLSNQAGEQQKAQQELAKLREDFEKLIVRSNEDRQQFEFDRNTLLEERKNSSGQFQDQLVNLQQQLKSVIEERDRLKAEKDDLAAELQAESAAHEELLTTIDKDHTSVVQAKEQLVRQLAAAEEARRELEQLRGVSADATTQAEVARLRAELDEARRDRDAAQQSLEARTSALHENESTLTSLKAAHQKLQASYQEFEHLQRTGEQTSAKKIQELEAERDRLAARAAEAETTITQLSSERQNLATSLASFEQSTTDKTSSLSRERDMLAAQLEQMATERNMLATELSASRKQHQQLIASLDQERGSLVVAQENTQKRLTQSEQEKAELERVLQETEAALESERQKAVQAQNDLNNQFHSQAQQIEQQHNSQIESLKSELVETRKLLADLRTASAEERDSLVGQRDEIQRTLSSEKSALEAKIAEMEAAHAAELKSERETLERQFHEDRTLLDERLSTVEQERTTLEASLKEVADYERTVSALRSERDNAIAALASAERIHSTALIESEQRYRDGLAAPARELEQIRLNAETMQAELIVARKMHVEVVSTIEKEREQFANLKADWERRLESVDEARRQVSARLDDREQAIGLLEEKIRLSEASLEKQNADIAELRNNLDAARRENEQLGLRSAATERQLREEIAALTQKIELISSEKQELASRIEHLETSHRQELEKSAEELRNANAAREHLRIALENERDQVKRTAETEKSELSTALEAKLEQAKNTLAGEREQLRKALEAERDSLRAELNSERATKQTEFAAIAREREEALRTAATEVARIEQELSRTREQRDIFKREKEELTRRIALATEQQKRMLDDIAAGLGHTPPVAPRPPASSVFEVSPDDGNINLPRVRPVQIRPPQVKVL